MKFTEGAFKDWGYELAREEFGGELLDGGPWVKIKNLNQVKDILLLKMLSSQMHSYNKSCYAQPSMMLSLV